MFYRRLDGVRQAIMGEGVGRQGSQARLMESFWAGLKRGYQGVYHWFSTKHLHRYVNEFEGRHNDRPLDTIDQMQSIVAGMMGRRLRYSDLIGPVETRLGGQMGLVSRAGG